MQAMCHEYRPVCGDDFKARLACTILKKPTLVSRVASYLHEVGIPVQTVDPNRGIIVASNSDFRPDQFANCALNAPQYLTKTQVEVTIFLTPQGPNRYSVFVAPIYSQTYVNLSNNKGRETKPCINTGLLERTLLRRLERH